MKADLARKRTRCAHVAVLAIAAALVLVGCNGQGGGWLPPGAGIEPPNNLYNFQGRANVGFTFACENGRLHLSLEYQDQGRYTLPDNILQQGNPFSIHAVADRLPPDLEDYFCIGEGQNGGLPSNEVLFQGTYTVQSGSPGHYATEAHCSDVFGPVPPDGAYLTGCKLTVDVRDNGDGRLSNGDYFSIKLFGGPDTGDVQHTVVPLYSRDGNLAGGNFHVYNP